MDQPMSYLETRPEFVVQAKDRLLCGSEKSGTAGMGVASPFGDPFSHPGGATRRGQQRAVRAMR